MLSDKACEECAGMLLEFVNGLPDMIVNSNAKRKFNASHSIIIASVKSSRDKWETFFERMHTWFHQNEIGDAVFIGADKLELQDENKH